jgi:ATP-dependent exoDNAse (exonuclease V) beta subunit
LPKVLPFLPLFDQTAPAEVSSQPVPAQHLSAPAPPDAAARAQALEIHRSFIVEAPAGSGKTGLLIQRFLKLLADEAVTAPEQVLAITFTLKATAEMRDRVLSHLEAARRDPATTATDFDRQTRVLALAVLERDRQLGWALLDHPHRLNIRTIDSVCAEIARTLPVLSGSGGRLTPAADAAPLHTEAARRTLLLLGSDDTDFNAALRDLLLHRDGNLADCEALIANMLSLRDQWGDLIPLTQRELDDAWLDANVLPRLELTLDHAICSQLARLDAIFPPDALADLSALAAELGEFDGYRGAPSPIAICAGRDQPPEAIADHLAHWHALIHILLTPSSKAWRRGFNVNHVGFEHDKHHKLQMKAIVDQLSPRDDLLDALCSVRALPPADYPVDQWAVAKSLFRVLSRALVELQLVFAERNQCDFTELSLLARHALSEDSGPEDLAAALGARLQHLLVDEMQDTSTGQYDLIEMLTRSWDGHSQTVFLVGDPRQSIYLFRQARVERFIRATRTQRLGTLPLTRLQLTANFRSQSALVERFNEDFALIFPRPDVPAANPHALPYSPAESTLPASPNARGLVWHAHPQPYVPPVRSTLASSGMFLTAAQLQNHQAKLDAREIRRIAQEWFVKQLPPGRTKPWTIAVLVRSRSHLTEIVAEFDNDKLGGIPYRAVEITPLSERQEVLDLTALTRALLHPADRVAALAILRAPWCGLSLAGLHTLTGADDPTLKRRSILGLIADRAHFLPDDSRQRVARVLKVLQAAASQRARLTTSQLVERAWHSLGGDVWLNSTELTNARRFLQLLDSIETPGIGVDLAVLAERLQKLYAEPNPIPDGAPCVELLTIHNAKGLEWDVVFTPALERMPGQNKSRLLRWSEIDSPGAPEDDAAHIMLAPIASRGQDPHPLYKWLGRVLYAREAAERQRLFYVACTRARQELHLFASPATTVNGAINPHPLSLLKSAWPAAQRYFDQPAVDIARKPAAPVDSPPLALAAAADWMRPTVQRLPLAFDPVARFTTAHAHKLPCGDDAGTPAAGTFFTRPEGSFAARSFGNAVHACLQILAIRILDLGVSPAALRAELPAWAPRIAAILRNDGLPQIAINQLTRETLAALENTLRDPDGLWLLAAHPGGDAELAVTALTPVHEPGRTAARAESVRIDRIFHAGHEPRAPGEDYLWIIDYKTATHSPVGLDDFLAHQRTTYGPQLEAYARILAPVRSESPEQVRLALYFPALPRLIWWNAPTPPPEN